jgi:plastocyanin
MRRTLLPLAAALALGLPLTACGGSDDDASGCSPVDSKVEVGAEDSLKFDSDSYKADAGCIEVTYKNNGSTAHNLLIDGKSGFKLTVGDVDTGTVDLPAGNYTLYCDLAGHRAAGMEADLSVS